MAKENISHSKKAGNYRSTKKGAGMTKKESKHTEESILDPN